MSTKIGEMNGRWAMLFRFGMVLWTACSLLLTVVVVPWAAWVTTQQFEDRAFRGEGLRFTRADALIMEARLMDVIAKQPPPDWKGRIEAIERSQAEIMRTLGRIEAKLEASP